MLEAAHGPSLFASGSGGVAEWSCSGLQSRVRRFDSDLRLQVPGNACPARARVVKLVDTRDLKSLGASHAGSIPAPGTNVVTVESIQPATVLRIMWATHAVDLSAVLLRT